MARVSPAVRAVPPVPPVRVDVLGPLRLTVGDQTVAVPGPKRGALLALLAMAEGRTVPVDDLLDALWPDDMPDAARASLHSHVSRLRRHLGQAANRLEGLTDAYRMRLDDGDTGSDVACARSLLAAAKTADPADAFRLLGEARALWRGPPLGEFAGVAPLAAWTVTLDDLRRAVDEAFTATALDTGGIGTATEVASALVARDPLSEPATVLLVRALDAAGRGADALRAAYDYRRRLATETGLEPSPALGGLERAIAGRTSTRPAGPSHRPIRLRGRDSELAALHRLLVDERLVTIVGPAGVGKTCLAAELAARTDHATTLWLAPVNDAAAIPHALAAALDLHVVHGEVLSACAALLSAGAQLLVVDNCEHLLARVRDVIDSVLDACPQLTVLATSREPLGLAAEQRFRLAPLPVTTPHDLDDISRSPAVAVFIDRARRVRPDFAPEEDDLRLVGEIVQRLDGMPLAIELAAGRLSCLALIDIHARLDRALDLLGDGHTTTLRTTIAWSYALLPSDEQRLFRNLGVFPDGFDLATAESTAADLGLAADAVGSLAHLVDASMVEPSFGAGSRYRMLDIMRSFAREQLEDAGEAERAIERFLRWALDLAAWIDRTSDTDQESLADRALRRELANLRSAWRLLRGREQRDDAVCLVIGLTDAAGWRDLTEVWEWALELADDPATETRRDAASVLGLAASCAWSRGDLERADRLARKGLTLAGDGAWRCEATLALLALSRGDLTAAVAHGTEAAVNATRLDQSLGVAALAAAYDGDLESATALNDRLASISASPTLEGFHHYVAGEIEALTARPDRAEDEYERAIALARHSGATLVEGIASVGLLTIRANVGRVADALDGYGDLIEYWERTGGWVQQWTTLRNLARLLHSLGEAETALFLDAAADHAPDAPPTSDNGDANRYNLSVVRAAGIRADAAVASRAAVLEIARQAIARHRATTSSV